MSTFFAFLVFVPLAIFLIGWSYKARGNLVKHQRETIDKTLMARSLHSEHPSFAFDPTSAVLIHEKEAIQGETPSVQSTRLYRNHLGEYFFFMCTAGSPGFIKHLSRAEAKRMLKPYRSEYTKEFGEQGDAGQDEP
jgi:hypothetical protein